MQLDVCERGLNKAQTAQIERSLIVLGKYFPSCLIRCFSRIIYPCAGCRHRQPVQSASHLPRETTTTNGTNIVAVKVEWHTKRIPGTAVRAPSWAGYVESGSGWVSCFSGRLRKNTFSCALFSGFGPREDSFHINSSTQWMASWDRVKQGRGSIFFIRYSLDTDEAESLLKMFEFFLADFLVEYVPTKKEILLRGGIVNRTK